MKKMLSIILAMIMTLSVFSCVSVYAVEETTAPVTENTTEGDVTEPSTDEPTTDESTTDESTTDEPTTEPEVQPTYATAISEVTAKVEGVYVKWTCDGTADKYNVYRRAGGEAAPTLIATVTTLDYTDKTVKNNVYYKYHIEALVDDEIKATSEGVLTQYLEAVEIRTTYLDTKTDLYSLTWGGVAGASFYDVYRRSAGETEYTFVKRVPSRYHIAREIPVVSGYHRFAVVAVNGKYKGALDTNGPLLKYFKTPTILPPEIVENGIHFGWKACENATGYRVYRRAGGEKYYTYLCTTTTTEYTDTNIESGKYYTYVVKGVYGDVLSSYMKGYVIQYVTKPKLEAIANATNGVYVRWTPVPGAKRYAIYRREAGGSYHFVARVDASKGNKYKDTTAVPLEYYRYTVEAVAESGHNSGYDKNGLFVRYNPLGTSWHKDAVINYYNFHINKSRIAKPDYTMKTWQNIDYQKTTGSNNAFVKEFDKAMSSQYFPENDPFVYQIIDDSDSTALFPGSGATSEYVKSATITRKSNSDVITIVMKDQVSPEIRRYSGIAAVSGNVFDFQGLIDEWYVNRVILGGSSNSTYKNFTIVATFSKDGKLISANHTCKDVTASMNMTFPEGIDKVNYNVQFDTYLTYSDFIY